MLLLQGSDLTVARKNVCSCFFRLARHGKEDKIDEDDGLSSPLASGHEAPASGGSSNVTVRPRNPSR